MPNKIEKIVAAAVQIEGVTMSLVPPARHGQVLQSLIDCGVPDHYTGTATQGFLTNKGRFVNRVEAMQLAYISGQKREGFIHDRQLFSEDLW